MREESLNQENYFLKEMIRTYYKPEIERLTAESTEWESKCYKYQDIIKEVREFLVHSSINIEDMERVDEIFGS